MVLPTQSLCRCEELIIFYRTLDIYEERSTRIIKSLTCSLSWKLKGIAFLKGIKPNPNKYTEWIHLPDCEPRSHGSCNRVFFFFFEKKKEMKAMFVSRKVVSGKPLSKLSCVCLPLEKLVNGKHFPVKEKFGMVSRKVFFLLVVFVFRKPLSKLSCVCLPLEKLVNEKHFPVNGKFGLVFRKVFSWKIWAENTFRKLWKI